MKPLPDKSKSGFKQGANKADQLKIKTLIADGADANEISMRLKISIESVKSFMPKKKKATKKKD